MSNLLQPSLVGDMSLGAPAACVRFVHFVPTIPLCLIQVHIRDPYMGIIVPADALVVNRQNVDHKVTHAIINT